MIESAVSSIATRAKRCRSGANARKAESGQSSAFNVEGSHFHAEGLFERLVAAGNRLRQSEQRDDRVSWGQIRSAVIDILEVSFCDLEAIRELGTEAESILSADEVARFIERAKNYLDAIACEGEDIPGPSDAREIEEVLRAAWKP